LLFAAHVLIVLVAAIYIPARTSALTTMFAVIGSSNLDIRSLSLHGAIRPRPRSHVHSRHASR
jgi:hypothetical protein